MLDLRSSRLKIERAKKHMLEFEAERDSFLSTKTVHGCWPIQRGARPHGLRNREASRDAG
jgi:hypothetical protein